MTSAENKEYYLNFLTEIGLTEAEITELVNEHPIGEAVVKERDRREGNMFSNGQYGRSLIIYRTNGGKWVILSYNTYFNSTRVYEKDTKKLIEHRYCFEKEGISGARQFIKQYRDILHSKTTASPKVNNKPKSMTSISTLSVTPSTQSIPFSSSPTSTGERFLGEALSSYLQNSKNYVIRKEYEVPELTGFYNLWTGTPRFDYAVVDKVTEQPKLFFEFDGRQHYDGQGYDQDDNFLKIWHRDIAKNGYAFHKQIPLIRIPYGVLARFSDAEAHQFVQQAIHIFLTSIKYYDKPMDKVHRDNKIAVTPEDCESVKTNMLNFISSQCDGSSMDNVQTKNTSTTQTHWIIRLKDGKRYPSYQSAAESNNCTANQIRKAIKNRSQVAKSYWKREEIEIKE